jgi:hypothetical protein
MGACCWFLLRSHNIGDIYSDKKKKKETEKWTASSPQYICRRLMQRNCYIVILCDGSVDCITEKEITQRCHSIRGQPSYREWQRDQANSARKRRQRKKTRHRIRGLTQRSSKLRCHHFACRSFDVTGKPFPFSFWALMLCMLLYCSGFRGIFGRPAEAISQCGELTFSPHSSSPPPSSFCITRHPTVPNLILFGLSLSIFLWVLSLYSSSISWIIPFVGLGMEGEGLEMSRITVTYIQNI